MAYSTQDDFPKYGRARPTVDSLISQGKIKEEKKSIFIQEVKENIEKQDKKKERIEKAKTILNKADEKVGKVADKIISGAGRYISRKASQRLKKSRRIIRPDNFTIEVKPRYNTKSGTAPYIPTPGLWTPTEYMEQEKRNMFFT